MVRHQDGRNSQPQYKRRRVLGGLAGVAGVVGFGTLSEPARAHSRFDVEFLGCTRVWIVVDPVDVDPGQLDHHPVVVNVIVEEPDGSMTCELVEIRRESVRAVQFEDGIALVRSYSVEDSRSIRGVLQYNDRDPRTSEPVCLYENHETCVAETSIDDAACVQAALDGFWEGEWYTCPSTRMVDDKYADREPSHSIAWIHVHRRFWRGLFGRLV